MSQADLSRELALAIGLASRVLTDTLPEQLINILASSLALPLTESKLQSLTLVQYNKMIAQGLQKNYSKQIVKKSLAFLQSTNRVETKQPFNQLQAYQPGDMPYSIRVAMASTAGQFIDGQFSTCQQYFIYQVSADDYRLIKIREVKIDNDWKAEQKYQYRAQLIADCQVVYSQSIGGLAASKVIKHGVHPVKLPGSESLFKVIDQLQFVLSTSPPPWIAKSMGLSNASTLSRNLKEEIL